MSLPWRIQIFDGVDLVAGEQGSGPVVLGRQDDLSEPLFQCRSGRLVVAGRDEDNVSRKHLRIEVLAGGRVSVQNVSKKVPVAIEGEASLLEPGQIRELPIPASVALGRRRFRILSERETSSGVEGLPEPTIRPGSSFRAPGRLSGLTIAAGQDAGPEALVRWFQAAMDVLQSAASSTDFYHKATRAVVEIVDLDVARILLREGTNWKSVAVYPPRPPQVEELWRPSRHVLERVCEERRTFWMAPGPSEEGSAESLIGVQSIVASPILDSEGHVIGALYGDRRQMGFAENARRITKMEAMLVELIAGGVAAGLARLKQEQVAIAFGQFFTPELAHLLASDPKMLEGRDAEISVLFCDIRGFSRTTDRLGASRTHDWLGDVLGVLSDCVLDRQGVLVDYVGDELMAMWGAPQPQADHAARACRAALAMFEHLPALNERWQSVLGESMDFGIGIDTGKARVGNTGSRRKYKYGPLGNTVNRASRVQGANKHFKTNILLTAATRAQLPPEFATRRIGQTRVLGMDAPLDLCELVSPDRPSWGALKSDYEAALSAYESRDFRRAAALLGPLVAAYPDDGPALTLMSRTAQCLVEPASAADLAFRLASK